MTKIEVKVLCAERKACPEVMEKMQELGFTNVIEVFNKVDADITAKLNFESKEEKDKKFRVLFTNTGEKIGQLSYQSNS